MISFTLFGKAWSTGRANSRYQSHGYRQAISAASISQNPKDIEGNDRLLSGSNLVGRNEQSRATAARLGGISDNASEEIELGDLSHFQNSRSMHRVLQKNGIGMRKDIQVYTE